MSFMSKIWSMFYLSLFVVIEDFRAISWFNDLGKTLSGIR